ncbi:MAG: hypothetical protein GY807_01885 [Gammaproteobacteria bacterium]|nr:hypothetical protein [Gammaproteobacteria bacterium]
MKDRRTVFIPVVHRGGSEPRGVSQDRLIEIYTQPGGDDRRAEQKAWDLIAAPLRPKGGGLYHTAVTAAWMVHKLGIKRPVTGLYQLFNPKAWITKQRLHLAGTKGPSGWEMPGNVEGRSAELGVALVLFMGAGRSKARQIIATGVLGEQPQGIQNDDAEILPVASVSEKMNLVAALARQQRLPVTRESKELLFFTPLQCLVDGDTVAVATLPEVEELRKLRIKVIPVKSLGKAVKVLGAHKAGLLLMDRVWLVSVLMLVAALIGGGYYFPEFNLPAPPSLIAESKPRMQLFLIKDDSDARKQDINSVSALFPEEDRLRLLLSSHSSKFRYVLQIDGDGKATIYDVQKMMARGGVWENQKYEFEWEIEDATLSLTLLLLVTDSAFSPAERAKVEAGITNLGVDPVLPSDQSVQYLWIDNGWKEVPVQGAIALASMRSGPSSEVNNGRYLWPDKVRSVLLSIKGLHFHGRTISVW